MIRTSLIIGFLCLVLSVKGQDHPAAFIWKDAEGSGRQQTVLFRRNFQLSSPVDSAMIHLFADSRYHLYVNGKHLNFGPSRFYLAHPEYDTYNLAPFLKPGLNVVAVEVLANGTVSFQVPLSKGGFIAWGEVKTEQESVSLATPDQWKMHASEAFDPDALRFSFACGPMEIFDGRKQRADWNRAEFDDSDWHAPVELADETWWGSLSPRTIPHLTQDELMVEQLIGMYRQNREEELYSFFIKTPDRTRTEYGSGKQLYACTYIFSSKSQEVECGLWWGSHFLNGQGPLEVSGREDGNPVRENRILSLKQGWNFFFVSYVAIWGGWDFYMAVPTEAGLIFSPGKNTQGGPFVLTSGPFPENKTLFQAGKNDPGDDLAILGNTSFQWTPRKNLSLGANPARDLVWREVDLDYNLKVNDFQVGDFKIDEPLVLVFDLGGKKLGRPFCEMVAGDGAIVDMAWSEDLNSKGIPFLYKRLQVNAGTRFICSEGVRRYETFKPYGVRYLMVRIDPGDKPATLRKLGVVEQVYPFSLEGSFSCSNPMLDKIWQLGWRTLRVCAEDSYTDTPFRERGLYAGDALPEFGITLATSGDSRLMKRSLMLFQDMYRDNMMEGKVEGLNDFVLKTLLELHWYYQVSGDMDFLKAVYPNYHSLMQHILDKKNDLGSYRHGRVFIEWTKIDKQADLTAYQALLAAGFGIMSELAGILGKEADSKAYAHEAELLTSVLNEVYWDPVKKVYGDGIKEGRFLEHHHPISSIYPMLFDLCTKAQKKSIMDYLEFELQDIGEETRNRKITPYGSFYLFSALYKEGNAALAERFMIQYWSRMIHQGDDTSWENFDIGGEELGGQGTASHAWSGHPTFFLSTEVLGVNLGFRPGFDRTSIEISPQSETLSWARGWVPHPAGRVFVDWRIKGDRLLMNVTLPRGIAYTIEPRGRLSGLQLDLNVKIQDSF